MDLLGNGAQSKETEIDGVEMSGRGGLVYCARVRGAACDLASELMPDTKSPCGCWCLGVTKELAGTVRG